jgi:DNA-binding MarR family transcriptional regulator
MTDAVKWKEQGLASETPLSDEDFQALAAFRAGLRRFHRFSEDAARQAGLTPKQHQLLVAVRGHAAAEPPTIGDLAEALQIKHHSAVELVNRVVHRGFAQREGSTVDNRRVHVRLTPAGENALRSLTAAHRQEYGSLESVLKQLTTRLKAK